MKFLLNIQCDNAAFHGPSCPDEDHICAFQNDEVRDILRDIATCIDRKGLSGSFEAIYDTNGNDVGRFAIKPDSYQP